MSSSNNEKIVDPLPCLHDGDAFIIYLKLVGTKCIKVLSIFRYPDNRNCSPVEETFADLTPEEKRSVVNQINRKHVGRTVLT